MKTEIRALAMYYQQFHHTLMGWQITLSGFVFAALLAADADKIKTNKPAIVAIWIAILTFPAIFLLAIAQFGKRIERLNEYLKLKEDKIPATWESDHKRRGFTLSGAGSLYFVALVLAQAAVNAFLAWSRL